MATGQLHSCPGRDIQATTPTSPSFATSQALGCANVETGTYFFRTTDSQGNTSSSSSATLTVVDAHDPVALAANTTLYLNGGLAVLQADNGTFNQSSDACGFTSEVKLASDPESAFTSSLSFASTGTHQITLRVTDPSGNNSTDEATLTVKRSNSRLDVLACNYSASANTPDGSCAYPGEECEYTDAGSGFTWHINANGNGCDCTARTSPPCSTSRTSVPVVPLADRASGTATRDWNRSRPRSDWTSTRPTTNSALDARTPRCGRGRRHSVPDRIRLLVHRAHSRR